MDAAGHFVVDFDRRTLRALTGFGVLFVSVGILFLLYAPELAREVREPVWLLRALGLVCVLFFGTWGMVAARHVLQFGAALVIDDEGVEDHASFARVGRIPWSEIAGFGRARLTGNDLLVIRLRDPERAVRSGSLWMRPVHWASLRCYGSPAIVPTLVIRTTIKELLATSKRLHKDAKGRASQAVAAPSSKP